jgi:asparagine synthase (glutamine-hydrolysing)
MWSRIYSKEYDTRGIRTTSEFFRPLFRKSGLNFLETCLKAEFLYKMTDDFLVNEDRTSMASGLEARVPLLDLDLVSRVLKMPGHLKVNGLKLKYLFKRLLAPALPQETLKKKKWGFAFSSYEQYKKDLRKTAMKILTPERMREVGIFNPEYVESILKAPASPRLRWHYFYIWLLVGFDIWHQIFIEGSRSPRDDLELFYSNSN